MLAALSVPRAFAQQLAGRETCCLLLGTRWRPFTSISENLWAAVVLVSSHESSEVWMRARSDVDPRWDLRQGTVLPPCAPLGSSPHGGAPARISHRDPPLDGGWAGSQEPSWDPRLGLLGENSISLEKTGELGEAILEIYQELVMNICFLMFKDVFDYLYINICLTNIAYLERCIYVHISLMVQTWILFSFFLIKCESACTKI